MTSVEVQDLVCSDCHHIIRGTKDIIEKLKNSKCKVCYTTDGLKRSIKQLWVCGGCGQTDLQSGSHLCFCPVKDDTVKITFPWKKNHKSESSIIQDQIDINKAERKLKQRVENVRNKPREVQEQILVELKKLNKSNEQIKSKEMKLDAIG